MIEIKIEYLQNYDLENWKELSYQFEGDAGFDLRAAINEPIILNPPGITNAPNPQVNQIHYYFDGIERKLIPTGIKVELPEGFELQIRSRSGLALKEGIFVLNSPGTVDERFRGEIGVILCNLSSSQVIIKPGDRIAQAIVNSIPKISLIKVEKVNETQRGENGFGSTGK